MYIAVAILQIDRQSKQKEHRQPEKYKHNEPTGDRQQTMHSALQATSWRKPASNY